MRSLLSVALLILISGCLFGQETTSYKSPLKNKFLQKSKTKKRIGQIMLGTGLAMIGTGIIIAATDDRGPYYINNQVAGGLLVTGGGGLSIASKFVFKISQKYKQRASTVIFHMEKAVQPYQHGLAQTSFPALKLKILF